MKRTFIEFPSATHVLKGERIADEAIRDMQRRIMRDEGDVIRGTNGLRKIRCAGQGRGKSGGIRVVYADYPDAGKCLIVAVFAKNVKENLSASEQSELAKLKAALDKLIAKGG